MHSSYNCVNVAKDKMIINTLDDLKIKPLFDYLY